ncbi:SCO4402 family protein [Agrobacterium sp. 22117]|uniref:SCO4402 family protein n=1 Tax=Agrobacterium sp. 22117 TaxID=3453880 RepID=UPI003F870621
MTDLHSPDLRRRLIDHLKDMSDLEYQKSHWGKLSEEGGTYDEFDFVVHFLYDDTELANNPYAMIGWCLRSESEALAIENLVAAIDQVFEKNGLELSDQEYLLTNEWPSVLQAASHAYELLKSG